MSWRSAAIAKSRKARREAAIARPELRAAPDGMARIAPQSPTSASIKQADPTTRALIDQALRNVANMGERHG